jgi:hypothetical protein
VSVPRERWQIDAGPRDRTHGAEADGALGSEAADAAALVAPRIVVILDVPRDRIATVHGAVAGLIAGEGMELLDAVAFARSGEDGLDGYRLGAPTSRGAADGAARRLADARHEPAGQNGIDGEVPPDLFASTSIIASHGGIPTADGQGGAASSTSALFGVEHQVDSLGDEVADAALHLPESRAALGIVLGYTWTSRLADFLAGHDARVVVARTADDRSLEVEPAMPVSWRGTDPR